MKPQKAALLAFICSLCSLHAIGQTIEINEEHLELLVNTTIDKNVELDMQDVHLRVNTEEAKMNKNDYLRLFSASGNLNEFNIRNLSGDNSVPNNFPKYNAGVTIPLDFFSKRKGQRNILLEERQLIEYKSEQLKGEIRAEVTTRYIIYIEQLNFLHLHERLEQFTLADFNTSEQKFVEGEMELVEYNESRDAYYASKMRAMEAKGNYLKAKAALEALTKVSLKELNIE